MVCVHMGVEDIAQLQAEFLHQLGVPLRRLDDRVDQDCLPGEEEAARVTNTLPQKLRN